MSSYDDFVLLDHDDSDPQRVERLAFGETFGRDEAWLRDTLMQQPKLLPIRSLDPSFGPLVPLCVELRCEAGRIDVAFINQSGLLTLVECKLWKNPEARRKVVAQTLDYASALSKWSYDDLQKKVAAATGRKGNVPFDLVREQLALEEQPEIDEAHFVDAVSRNLRKGRFMLIVAGDGIRSGVENITSLVQRNAALGFSFGLVEVALYGLSNGSLLVQPRTIAKTRVIERTFFSLDQGPASPDAQPTRLIEADDAPNQNEQEQTSEGKRQAEYRRWWQPVIDAPLENPEQPPPSLFWPNNIRAQLPTPGIWVTCYRASDTIGVGTGGRKSSEQVVLQQLLPQKDEILQELPPEADFRKSVGSDNMTYACVRQASEFATDDEQRAWLSSTLNSFINALRPRIHALSN